MAHDSATGARHFPAVRGGRSTGRAAGGWWSDASPSCLGRAPLRRSGRRLWPGCWRAASSTVPCLRRSERLPTILARWTVERDAMVPERVLVLLAEACDAVILGARRFKHRADHFLGRVVPAVCLRAAKAPRHEWSDSAPLLFIEHRHVSLAAPAPYDLHSDPGARLHRPADGGLGNAQRRGDGAHRAALLVELAGPGALLLGHAGRASPPAALGLDPGPGAGDALVDRQPLHLGRPR